MRMFTIGFFFGAALVLFCFLLPSSAVWIGTRIVEKVTTTKCPSGYVCDPVETPTPTPSNTAQ